MPARIILTTNASQNNTDNASQNNTDNVTNARQNNTDNALVLVFNFVLVLKLQLSSHSTVKVLVVLNF